LNILLIALVLYLSGVFFLHSRGKKDYLKTQNPPE
jgi:hypothetical protein